MDAPERTSQRAFSNLKFKEHPCDIPECRNPCYYTLQYTFKYPNAFKWCERHHDNKIRRKGLMKYLHRNVHWRKAHPEQYKRLREYLESAKA